MPNIEGTPVEDAAKKAMKSYEDATKAYADKQKAQAQAASKVAQKISPAMDVETDQWGVPVPGWKKSVDAAATVPQSVDQYQQTIEAKRLPSAPYDAKTAAMLVPKEVDEYQAKIEAPRVMPGHSLGEPVTTEPKPDTQAAKQSRVAKLLAELKAEQSTKGKPNIADIIEAASAGWGGHKAAYVEKQATEAERAAAASELEKRAQLEKALQDERLAQELKIAQLKLGGIAPPSLASLTPGQAAAAKLMSGIGGQ